MTLNTRCAENSSPELMENVLLFIASNVNIPWKTTFNTQMSIL